MPDVDTSKLDTQPRSKVTHRKVVEVRVQDGGLSLAVAKVEGEKHATGGYRVESVTMIDPQIARVELVKD